MTAILCNRCGDVVEMNQAEAEEELAIAKLRHPAYVGVFVPLCEDCAQEYLAWRATVHPQNPKPLN